MSNKPTKTYIGDSVYAEIEPWGQITLTTENGLPDDPSNRIVLEPRVAEALLALMLANGYE